MGDYILGVDKKELLIVIVIAIVISIVGVAFYTAITASWCQEGEVTDKYILPNAAGFPRYYLVLSDELDISVSEKTYYEYGIGDMYNPCDR